MSTGWSVRADALLSDLDGVLADSHAVVEAAWTAWAVRAGVPPAQVLAVAHGVRPRETFARFAPDRDPDVEAAWFEQVELAQDGPVTAVPGGPALLRAVPADRVAVVTSGTRAIARRRLAAVGVPEPDVLVTADDVAVGKPDPTPYLAAAAALGVAATRCVVVEDAPAGIAAGRAAGATVIGVATSHPTGALTAAHVVVPDPAALTITAEGEGLTVRVAGPR